MNSIANSSDVFESRDTSNNWILKVEGGGEYGAPEGTRKLKSFEWLDCTNNKVLNVATAQTIKFRMSRLHKQ